MLLETFDEVSIFIEKHIVNTPICIETGTAYGFPEGKFHFNTTSSIVKSICEPKKGHLYSIDLDDHSKNINKLFKLGSTDLDRVTLLVGDSVKVLKNITKCLTLPKVDLLCLDSGNDADLLLEEYFAIKSLLAPKHYVLVDDIHNTGCVKFKKIVPELKSLGYQWTEIPTNTGLFVSSIGYPVPQGDK